MPAMRGPRPRQTDEQPIEGGGRGARLNGEGAQVQGLRPAVHVETEAALPGGDGLAGRYADEILKWDAEKRGVGWNQYAREAGILSWDAETRIRHNECPLEQVFDPDRGTLGKGTQPTRGRGWRKERDREAAGPGPPARP